MTHAELQSHLKGHHLVCCDHHGRMAKTHRGIAKALAVSDPKISALHRELADIHVDASTHHAQRAESFGDIVEAKVDGTGELEKLHKLLSSE